MDLSLKSIAILLTLWVAQHHFDSVQGQRSLLHLKRDLEYRLSSYLSQKDIIRNILSTSIYPTSPQSINGPPKVFSSGNVRFTDIIIPTGSLVLEPHVAQPTVRILVNKTQSYMNSKMNDLYQISSQLDRVKQLVDDPAQHYIYKGVPNVPTPQMNFTVISGTRVFKQLTYGHIINTKQVDLQQINFTRVDRVMDDTYMTNPQFGLRDKESRLFFEGKKTFWKTLFSGKLKSGCCDRLKPLHTNRMMTRSTHQEVLPPVLLLRNERYHKKPIIIRELVTNLLHNREFHLAPGGNGLISTSVHDNFIHLNNLVSIRHTFSPEIPKTLIFKDVLMVDEANLYNPYNDNKLIIGIISSPAVSFDLSHENYLLKFSVSKRNNTDMMQRVTGTVVVNGATHFVRNLDAFSVNGVPEFSRFVAENVVRIDRPAIIKGFIQFNALPTMLSPIRPQSSPQNVPIMLVNRGLEVGLLNGMRLPDDIVVLPIQPNRQIRIRGPRQFVNRAIFRDLVYVRQLINNIQMPSDVIPLHLNDFIDSVGFSNLWFTDGIVANHISVHSGQFDDIVLKDLDIDAQGLIMRSLFTSLPNGSHLIKTPLHVKNLRLYGHAADEGLLNGFRPQNLIELSGQPVDLVQGHRTFLAPVEATECIFNDINHIKNWTNHLIRIDRPNTVQSIHTKLIFAQPMLNQNPNPPQVFYDSASSVNIGHLQLEFYPNVNPTSYLNNINFSPEFYMLHQALIRSLVNHTEGRIRVLDQVKLMGPLANGAGVMNGILPSDVVTLDEPFRFADRFTMVGKVTVLDTLRASRITSNYPIDVMDLVQFDKYRIPIVGSLAPIRLNNLVLSTDNRASFVRCQMLNGISFDEFANSIMSLTRPQDVYTSIVFGSPVSLEGLVRSESSLNGVKEFRKFANSLKGAKYSFEDGLQCNSVMIKN